MRYRRVPQFVDPLKVVLPDQLVLYEGTVHDTPVAEM
jgi:hypothetical protein